MTTAKKYADICMWCNRPEPRCECPFAAPNHPLPHDPGAATITPNPQPPNTAQMTDNPPRARHTLNHNAYR